MTSSVRALVVSAGLTLALAAGCGTGPGSPGGGPGTASGTAPGSASGSPCASPDQAGTPAVQAPGGKVPVLNAVQFTSASDGWVVGSDRIVHTGDAGAHWVTQYTASSSAQLDTVDFADSRHGWVTGAATILATADGGRHWRALPEPCPLIRAVHFVSARAGFAVAGGTGPALGVPLVGGVLLGTTDGGLTWHRIASPADVQTACFSTAAHGWLGADGNIYGTADGGRTWRLAVRGPARGGAPGLVAIATVQCAGPRAAWAEVTGPGAAMSHQPQIGYHTYGTYWRPVFAEQYFPHPRVPVRAAAPGVYPGPFSAISADQAAFVGFCGPCSPPGRPRLLGTAPMDLALRGGAVLLQRGLVSGLAQATGAAFVSATDGWVVGYRTTDRQAASSSSGSGIDVESAIMHTADGGRTWHEQYGLAVVS